MAITKEQRDRFKSFVTTNNIKQEDITADQARQVLDTGTYDGFQARTPEVPTPTQEDITEQSQGPIAPVQVTDEEVVQATDALEASIDSSIAPTPEPEAVVEEPIVEPSPGNNESRAGELYMKQLDGSITEEELIEFEELSAGIDAKRKSEKDKRDIAGLQKAIDEGVELKGAARSRAIELGLIDSDVKAALTPGATPAEDGTEVATVEEDPKTIAEEKRLADEQVTNEFQGAMESGDFDAMNEIIVNNPLKRAAFNSAAKNHFKTQKNAAFVKKYTGMNNNQMYSAFKEGTIVPNSEQYALLPIEQRTAFNKFVELQDKTENIGDFDPNAKQNSISFTDLEAITAGMFDTSIIDKVNEIRNNPRVSDLTNKLNTQAEEINKFDRDFEKEQDKLEKELADAGFTPAIIRSKLRDNAQNMRDERYDMMSDYRIIQGDLASEKSNIEDDIKLLELQDTATKKKYEFMYGEYKDNRANMSAVAKLEFEEQNKLLAENRAFENAKKLLEFKAELSDTGAKGSYEERDDGTYFFYDDPTIPPKKVLNNTVTTGVTSAVAMANDTVYSETYDMNNNGVGFTTENTSLGLSQIELLNAPNGTRIPTRLNKDQLSPNNPGGKECGEYVNDIMAETVGATIGSKWEDKLSYANESTGTVGSVAVWKVNPGVEDKWGHTGIIVGETDNDEWVIKSSNVKGVGIVTTGTVPKSAISGYRSTGAIGTEKVINSAQEEFLSNLDVESYASDKDIKATAEALGLTPKDVFEYRAKNDPEMKKEDYKSALTQIDKMLEAGGGDGLSDALGMFSIARALKFEGKSGSRYVSGTDAADFEAQFNSFVSTLTLPNLDKMSGVLTDKDIELLKNAGTSLNLDMSQAEFTKELDSIKGALNRAVSGTKIEEKDVIYTDKDGLYYSVDTLTKEITDSIDLYESSNGEEGYPAEDWEIFLRDNDLIDKL